MKDWTGNKQTTFVALGASNHTDHDREEHDFYATDPKAIDLLLGVETFDGDIWENCCGAGHLSKRLEEYGLNVISTDLIDRGYGDGFVDFFECTEALAPNIITNPPYKFATQWVQHSLDLLPTGGKLALFLKIQFLESDDRRELLAQYPAKTVYYCRKRVLCGMNGDFRAKDKDGNPVLKSDGTYKLMSSAAFYAWFVWEKGYQGTTELIPIN